MCNVIEDVVVVVVFMGRSSFDYEMYDSVSEKMRTVLLRNYTRELLIY